jgi:hypothetical protein
LKYWAGIIIRLVGVIEADDIDEMDAQTGPQNDRRKPHLFRPGQTGNPGGKQRKVAFNKVVADLTAELGCEPTASQQLIIEEIAQAKTGRTKVPAATVGRLMRQLGLPKKVEQSADKPSLSDHLRQYEGG